MGSKIALFKQNSLKISGCYLVRFREFRDIAGKRWIWDINGKNSGLNYRVSNEIY